MSNTLDWWHQPRRVTVVVDNDSWVLPYAQRLVDEINRRGDDAILARTHEQVPSGTVAFYLGCVHITPPGVLARNHRNLVVHASDLPKGRGFSPMTWLILEGVNEIPVCLLEATNEVDAGAVIYRSRIRLSGTELNDELRIILGEMHIDLCLRYLVEGRPPVGIQQQGTPTFYPRRRPMDSRLDPSKSIAEQFNLLRTIDNDRYPAFFDYQGQRYCLKIEKVPKDET